MTPAEFVTCARGWLRACQAGNDEADSSQLEALAELIDEVVMAPVPPFPVLPESIRLVIEAGETLREAMHHDADS